MVAAGHPAREAFLHFDDRPPIKVNLESIPSRFNFLLMLAQSETERILEEYLADHGVLVERNSELKQIDNVDVVPTCQIQKASGLEVARAEYVIGCDGAHSTVRSLLNIPFAGGVYPGSFILGDVHLKWSWAYGSVQTKISPRGLVAAFPLDGRHRYRLILARQEADSDTSPEISLEEFRKVVDEISEHQIEVQDSIWLTRFRIHHRMVTRFRQGRAFLAGDAAHIHSPAGGQGMNIGIQDAFNLCHKLQKVLQQNAPTTLLDDYQKQRMPIARKVLRSTDLAFRLILWRDNALVRFLRRKIITRLLGIPTLQRRGARLISEVDIARREINRI
jgi:2-polyprenyl-6-methoxyphenol hydroxylase-like FAD-dependent oxidoreductase